MEKLKESYVKFNPEWGIIPPPPLPQEPIYSIVTEGARKWPSKTALVCYDYSISYQDLDLLSDKLARALVEEFGVKRWDRVAVMLPNCIQHTIAFFAILKIGAIETPLNVMYRPREIVYQINDAETDIVIALNVYYPLIAEAQKETRLKNIVLTDLTTYTSGKVPDRFIAEKKTYPGTHDFDQLVDKYKGGIEHSPIDVEIDLAQILYTSGTTGRSKGVMEPHRTLWANNQARYVYGFTADDTNLQIMPMFHCSGFCLVQLPILSSGGTVVLVPFFNPKECIKYIQAYNVSIIFAPPTFYTALLNEPEVAELKNASLRITISCGGPQTEPTRLKWTEITGLELMDAYGMTETQCIGTSVSSMPYKHKPGAIGSAFNGEVKIVDEEGNIVPVGTVGETMFKGPGLAAGYWKKPEETRDKFKSDGWLRSGDACWMDDEGFIYFSDRYKDLIVASGYNVAPLEVESVLMGHTAVKEAAVIGIPDEYRGETVKAFISLTENAKAIKDKDGLKQDILKHCKNELATFKVPKDIEITDEIPKNAVGKIMRRQLREKQR